MPTLPVREHLEELKQGLTCFFMRLREGSMDTLVFERAKKRFGRGVILTVALPAHAHDNPRLLHRLAIRSAGGWTPSVRVMEQFPWRTAARPCHA